MTWQSARCSDYGERVRDLPDDLRQLAGRLFAAFWSGRGLHTMVGDGKRSLGFEEVES
jgi:hypothetical protein